MPGESGAETVALAANLLEALTVIVNRVQSLANESGDVTRSQLVALRFLIQHGSSTMLDLAAGVGVTAPTMTATVKVLLRKGLVARRHDDDDWRSVLVSATEAGTIAHEQAKDTRTQALAAAIVALTPEQRALLTLSYGALSALAQRLAAQ